MKKIIITTDSTADLSKDLTEKLNVKVIPLYVRFADEIYKDGIDITTEELYKKVSETNIMPKTTAVSPGDFVNFFEPLLNEGYEIVHIGISSKLSGTYQSALIAKDLLETEDLYIVDSLNLSSGIGLLVLKAVDFVKKGLSAKQIKEELVKIVPNVRSQFVIKTLDYLHKGGRASGLAALVGTMLKIRPIIQVRDGGMDVYKKPMGRLKRGMDIMMEDLFSLKDNLDYDYVMVTHSINNEGAKYMINKINSELKFKQVIESSAGCVISSHCGEGTIGVLYIIKE